MHIVSSFEICQGMSWQHLSLPYGWKGVILLSLSLSHPGFLLVARVAINHPGVQVKGYSVLYPRLAAILEPTAESCYALVCPA